MDRKTIKEFLETLHFHGYIDHDITKLDDLIDVYYPKEKLIQNNSEFEDNALICLVPDALKEEIKSLWTIPNDGHNPRVRALKKHNHFSKKKDLNCQLKKQKV